MFVVLMKSWALEQCTIQMGGELSARLWGLEGFGVKEGRVV